MNAEITAARERFVGDTEAHEMTVLRDDGLYRHLRFRKPGTSVYYFDLVTWPGYLAIVGDAGDYVFSRTEDMFEFFGPKGARGGFEDARWGINPQYWSEKLQAPSPRAAERYSYDLFRAHVIEWFENAKIELEDYEAEELREELQRQVIDRSDVFDSENRAHAVLAEFECKGHRIHDSWEWNLREYDSRFLWCCWAIVWGVSQYRATHEMQVTGS